MPLHDDENTPENINLTDEEYKATYKVAGACSPIPDDVVAEALERIDALDYEGK